MGKQNRVPLEKKDIILYEGDWDKLATILAPRKVKPTYFIRELVHRTIARIEAQAQDTFKTVEISNDDLAAGLDLPLGEGEPVESGRAVQPGPGTPHRAGT